MTQCSSWTRPPTPHPPPTALERPRQLFRQPGRCRIVSGHGEPHLRHSARDHTIIDRRLYLPGDWAADEEQRELADVPEQVEFATKPQLAAAMLTHAHTRRIWAPFAVGNEVYGGRKLRACIRGLGMNYVMAVKHDHTVTLGPLGRKGGRGVRGQVLAGTRPVSPDVGHRSGSSGTSVMLSPKSGTYRRASGTTTHSVN